MPRPSIYRDKASCVYVVLGTPTAHMKVWKGGCGLALEAWSHVHCRCGLTTPPDHFSSSFMIYNNENEKRNENMKGLVP